MVETQGRLLMCLIHRSDWTNQHTEGDLQCRFHCTAMTMQRTSMSISQVTDGM